MEEVYFLYLSHTGCLGPVCEHIGLIFIVHPITVSLAYAWGKVTPSVASMERKKHLYLKDGISLDPLR